MTKKYAFDFDEEEMTLIESIREHLKPTVGKVSMIQALRWALLSSTRQLISTGSGNGHDEGVTSTKLPANVDSVAYYRQRSDGTYVPIDGPVDVTPDE